MRVEGTGGAAVSRVNDPEFAMFATKSGRDIHDDLARAHAPVVSPIKLQPLTKAEEAALYSEHGGNGRTVGARPTIARKPALPARLPAPGPGPVTVEAVGPSAPPPADQAGRGQTNQPRQRVQRMGRTATFDHAQIVADYYTGLTTRAVAKIHGCHEVSVTKILNAFHAVRLPRTGKLPILAAASAVIVETVQDRTLPPLTLVQLPDGDLAAAGAAIVDHLHDRVSLPTTVRRLIQAGFTAAEVAVYCGVEEQLVIDAMVVLVRQAAI